MHLRTATILYFSPTGTTEKIVHAAVRGMEIVIKQQIDLTFPCVRSEAPPLLEGEIVFIGIPVYGMGVPKIFNRYLTSLKGNNRPAVLIVVYGNASEGTALNELYTIANHAGFQILAAGSFIGEHTLSTEETPIAKGRPDCEDLHKAEEFGRNIMTKIRKADCLKDVSIGIPQSKISVMGRIQSRMRKGISSNNGTKLFSKTPVANMSLCNHCGACVKPCPMGAIDRETLGIDENQCFHCFRCAKRCPQKARKIIYRPKYLVAKLMTAKTNVKREPILFL